MNEWNNIYILCDVINCMYKWVLTAHGNTPLLVDESDELILHHYFTWLSEVASPDCFPGKWLNSQVPFASVVQSDRRGKAGRSLWVVQSVFG